MTNKSYVRPGYPTVTTGLNVKNPEEYIAWAQRALGAEPGMHFDGPDGKIAHAEIHIGDSRIAIDRAMRDPETRDALFHVYVADVDAAYARAIAAGGTSKMAPMDMFFGERMGIVVDPTGNSWGLATFLEELTPAEMNTRREAFMAKMQQK